MLLSRYFAPLLTSVTVFINAGPVYAQNFPSKPVRVVTAESGGAADLITRLVAQGIGGSLGQPVIVDNRGGSAVIPVEMVAKSAPDGHTVLLYSGGLWTLPMLRPSISWDAIRDFAPVTLVARSPNVLVVHPSLPVSSVRDLIALAKARPGQLNYAEGTTGAMPHLAAELLKAMAGVDIVRVPYKGTALALNDLIGGQVQLMFATAGGVAAQVKSGRLKALAVTSAEPSTLLPGLTTVAASGLPGYEAGTIFGVFAPAGTAGPVVTRLNQEIVQVLNRGEVKEKLFSIGVEAVGSAPAQLVSAIKTEVSKWGKVIRDAGIRAE